ncbi:MAG: RHS repeat protein [Spirochaetes bacterium]|nr:RHS repeat protein [Spirochaetota bacterium]
MTNSNSSGQTYTSINNNEEKEITGSVKVNKISTITQNKKEDGQSNAAKTGDPILITTGDLTISEYDLSLKYRNDKISIFRNFLTSRGSSHSFGPGWAFNYDTRIIQGTKPKAQYAVDGYGRLLEGVKDKRQETKKKYDKAISAINTLIAKLEGNKTNVSDVVIPNLQDEINRDHPDYVKSELQKQLSQLQEKLSELIEVIGKAYGKKGEIDDAWKTTRGLLDAKIIELDELEKQAEKERDRSNRNNSRNRYVYNASDPVYYEDTGLDSVTWIDEQGIPHLYFLESKPDYNSNVLYDDGTINYYPYGSLTVSALPNDNKLSLEAGGSCVITGKSKNKYIYSYYGQLKQIVGINGNVIGFTYNANHELASITGGNRRIVSLENENGRIVKVTDPIGRVYSYKYDSAGRLSEVTDAEGAAVKYKYSGNLITEIIKPDGSSRKYVYEELNGKMVMVQDTDEEGNTEYFRYFPSSNYTEYEDASGIVERYYYNNRYLTTKIEHSDGSFVEMEYDDKNNLIKKTDEMGGEYRYRYDANRNLVEATDPEGRSESREYNRFNEISSYTDKAGNTTNYSYNAKGNLIRIRYPDSTEASYVYDNNGRVTEYKDQKGNWKRFKYDAVGNIIKFIDQAGNEIEYKYNDDGKVIQVKYSDGSTKSFTYDNRKDLVRAVDRNKNETDFVYNRHHLLIKVIKPLDETIEYIYRADGKMKEKIIGDNNHTRYDYDERGRVIRETQVETGAITNYEYNAAGQLTATRKENVRGTVTHP